MCPSRPFSPGRGRLALVALATTLPLLALLLAAGAPVQSAGKDKPARQPGDLSPGILRRGDHVCLIGNTLADRMQHDGWLETDLQSRFPGHDLVFRNLGFSGDELTLRLRSEAFGSPDHWLDFCKADVVFAFFGYNESFAGKEGLDKFKKDLAAFIKHTLGQKYNGQGAPRLVLFSPIAHEDLHNPNLPDGKENNGRLALYTAAMADVAGENGVPFVDLYKATLGLYASARKPLTINGIHLTAEGNRQLARVIDKALFPDGPEVKRDARALDKLRRAVLDKDFYWFNRYRTVDGYSIYGGRSHLSFKPDNQTNRVVAQREMEVLDVMTANRDKRVWAVARGGDLKVDDSNTPPFIPVKTNKPGPGPNGEHIFLSGEDAIKRMTVGKGLKVTLFADEKMFPELVKPVQMAFDPRGRLWVAVWPTYPHWKPKEVAPGGAERNPGLPNDKILILEDTRGTGKADKCTVFADHLHCPTGFEFYNGGVLVAQAPGIVFLKDTDGDDRADVRVRVLDGIDSADTHHTANSFALDPGGALYFQEGTFHHTQVETPWKPTLRNVNAGVYRYEPRTQKFDAYITFGFANPHGHVFDHWGQDIVIDGTGANPYHAALFSGHLDYPVKHDRPPQVYQQRTRPCPGVEILSSRHFPEDFQGNLLVPNVIGFQGILRYRLEDKGASFGGTEAEPILYSSDPNFRPSDLKVAADGSLYFLDWQNPIIGHMQHNLRDPSRDRTHGRIYRVTCPGRPLLAPVKIAGEPVEKLLDVLKQPEDRVRYRARIEIGGRDSALVIAAVEKWVAALDRTDKDYEHHLLEALWVHQAHNVVDQDLLRRLLGSKEFRARAAATRVLCYWRDRVPDALELLKKQAADEHPRVRLEAVRAASFFTVPEAIEVALISAEHPPDPYIDFVRGETIKALDPYVKKAIAAGREIKFTTTAGARFFLKNVSTDDLLKMKRGRGVYLELLFRKGVRDEFRKEALTGLAGLDHKDEVRVLLDAIRSRDGQGDKEDEGGLFDLIRLLTGRDAAQLKAVRGDLEKLALGAHTPVTRELGFVALVAADGSTDKAWALATRSVTALQDLVNAMPLVSDPGQRAALYPKVLPLLDGLPKELAPRGKGKRTMGRYVRIELPGKRKTLTLAEVEVYSDGRNVARHGKASQKNTAHGGDAARAIDGNKSSNWGDGGQTHTQENTDNPWWQVDLGAEYPISSVVVYNRTDGALGKRLAGFTLKILDQGHRTVFERRKQKAPAVRVAYEVGSESPEHLIRRAAMNALTSVRGQEEETFKALARFVRSDADRHDAIGALLRIPSARWPRDEVMPLLDTLLGYIRKVPANDRTSPGVLEAMQLADALASLLPLQDARRVRKELGELGVRVIRIATVPEQMLYDKDRIVVKAGKPVEVILENSDLMPHNFVVTQPGALEEVGKLAEETATRPGAAEKGYVPDSKRILVRSKLVQPRESERISFTAPGQPGVYPYVCTYPGHWRRMYGAMYVVEDLDAYLADPEGYLVKHSLPVKDELLKFNRPRKEWKFEDLAGAVQQMDQGRSFSNGKQMFRIAACVSCHKLNGDGVEIGPDLTKLDPKLTQVDILKDILEPSFRINENYQTWKIELKSGKVVTGLILKETADEVRVIENPLAKSEPVVVKKSDIDSREKSPTSAMPVGLLDKLRREEILDLVAYIASRGDKNSKLFQGGHDHKHAH